MLGNDYEYQTCSIAAALEVVGERWSLLIVRDVLPRVRRFDELQSDLGVARNVLQARLTRLLEHGVIERRPYQERPPRYEYLLTEKGLDLWPTIVALMQWGDRYAPPAGRPAGAARAPRLRRRTSTRTASASAAGPGSPPARLAGAPRARRHARAPAAAASRAPGGRLTAPRRRSPAHTPVARVRRLELLVGLIGFVILVALGISIWRSVGGPPSNRLAARPPARRLREPSASAAQRGRSRPRSARSRAGLHV